MRVIFFSPDGKNMCQEYQDLEVRKRKQGILGRTRGSEMSRKRKELALPHWRIPVPQLIKTKRVKMDQIFLPQTETREQQKLPGRLAVRMPYGAGSPPTSYRIIVVEGILITGPVTQRGGNLLHRTERTAGRRETAPVSRWPVGSHFQL